MCLCLCVCCCFCSRRRKGNKAKRENFFRVHRRTQTHKQASIQSVSQSVGRTGWLGWRTNKPGCRRRRRRSLVASQGRPQKLPLPVLASARRHRLAGSALRAVIAHRLAQAMHAPPECNDDDDASEAVLCAAAVAVVVWMCMCVYVITSAQMHTHTHTHTLASVADKSALMHTSTLVALCVRPCWLTTAAAIVFTLSARA